MSQDSNLVCCQVVSGWPVSYTKLSNTIRVAWHTNWPKKTAVEPSLLTTDMSLTVTSASSNSLVHNDSSYNTSICCHVFTPTCHMSSCDKAITPKSASKTLAGAMGMKSRLQKCWKLDLSWELYPTLLQSVI